MVVSSRVQLMAKRAAYVHFAIAFFPTLAALTYLMSPGSAWAIARGGCIAYCTSLLVCFILAITGILRSRNPKPFAPEIGWVAGAQGAFTAQALIIIGIMERM